MVRLLHSSAHLRGEKRKRSEARVYIWTLGTQIFVDIFVTPDRGEKIIGTRRRLPHIPFPEAVGVPAEDGQKVLRGHVSIVPARGGVIGSVETSVLSELQQSKHVPGAFARAAKVVFVFDLYADDRTAIFPELPFYLLANLSIESPNVSQILRVTLPRGSGLHQPIRQAAIANLAVRPRPYPKPHIHPVFSAKREKLAQIAPPGPIEFSFFLLVINPKYVGGNDIDASSLHFENLFFPRVLRISRVVKLAHDGEPRLSIKH